VGSISRSHLGLYKENFKENFIAFPPHTHYNTGYDTRRARPTPRGARGVPTHIPQVKLSKLFDLVRNAEPIRKEWIENQRKLLEKQNNTSWDMFRDYPQKNYKKIIKKLEENQEKTGEKPDQNYGLIA